MPHPINNAASILASDHLSGSGTLVLKAGTGAYFGTPSVGDPIRVTVAARSTLIDGQIGPTTICTIFLCTTLAGDTLSGLTAVEGTTDRIYRKNDPVGAYITAGMLEELEAEAAGALLAANNLSDLASAVTARTNLGMDPLLAAKQDVSSKGVANGYASLGSDGVVPSAQLPASAAAGDVYRPAGAHLASRHRADAGVITGANVAAGSALFTAASSQYLFAADRVGLRVGPAGIYTCGWVRFSTVANGLLWGKGFTNDWADVEWFMYCSSGLAVFWLNNGVSTIGSRAAATLTMTTGTWYFLEAWYDSSDNSVHCQINGANAGTDTYTKGAFTGTRQDFQVGREGASSTYFDGNINSLFVTQRIPTSTERAWLYNAGNGRLAEDVGQLGPSAGELLAPGPNSGEWWDCNGVQATRLGYFSGVNLVPPANSPTYGTQTIPRNTAPIGSLVTNWLDQGDDGFMMAGAGNPTYRQDGLNDRPSVVFDGIASNFSAPARLKTYRGLTAIYVLKPGNTSADTLMVERLRSIPGKPDLFIGLGKPSNSGFAGNSPAVGAAGVSNIGAASGGFTSDFTAGGILTVMNDGIPTATTDWRIYRNNIPLTLRSVAVTGLTSTVSTLGSDVSGKYFDGRIAERLLFDHALSMADWLAILYDLKARWGITGFAGTDPTNGFTDTTKGLLVAEGNSLAAGFYTLDPATQSALAQLQALLGASSWDAVNIAAGGRTIQGMTDSMGTLAGRYWYRRPKKILILWEGRNSIAEGLLTAESAYGEMSVYIREAKRYGYQILLISATPSASGTYTNPDYPAQQAIYDTLVTANTAAADAVWLPTSDARTADPTNVTYYSDGVHMTAAGYGVVAAALRPLVLAM